MKKILLILSILLTTLSYGQDILDSLVFEKINEYRIENNVHALTLDTSIYKVAYLHSKYLHDNDYPFNYPYGSGHYEEVLVNPSDRLRAQGVPFVACGENIASFSVILVGKDGWVDMEDMVNHVLKLWINSPGHHKLMLSPKPTKGALAIYIDSGKVFVVLNVVK